MIALGVDIGGTTVKLGVVDSASGNILTESNFPTPQTGSQSVVDSLAEHVRALHSAYPEIDRIGVGVPGAMNRDRSLVRYPPNMPGWKEEPLAEFLRQALPDFLVEVDNDAKVAALAEARLGAGRGLTHFVLVTLGTGVGGAIYATEGSWSGIFRGESGGAGEFGHLSIDRNGAACACGSRGCIEAYLGQRYLSNRTKAKLEKDASIESSLRNISGELTPRDIAVAMEHGDKFARSVFIEAGEQLGFALSGVAKLLDIHQFIIGGGVAEAGAPLFEEARKTLRENVFENQKALVQIHEARFKNKAGIIGAAMLVAQD